MKTKKTDFEERVARVFGDFFHEILAPYLDEKFAAIDKRFDEHDKRFDEHDTDHEKIFRAVERNRDEHDEIFQDLDGLERLTKVHEKRLKRLEASL